MASLPGKVERARVEFAYKLSALTGLDPGVIYAWTTFEVGNSPEIEHNVPAQHYNFLNWSAGNNVTGSSISGRPTVGCVARENGRCIPGFKNVDDAAIDAAYILYRYPNYYGRVLDAAKKKDPVAQIKAIIASPWASSHYGNRVDSFIKQWLKYRVPKPEIKPSKSFLDKAADTIGKVAADAAKEIAKGALIVGKGIAKGAEIIGKGVAEGAEIIGKGTTKELGAIDKIFGGLFDVFKPIARFFELITWPFLHIERTLEILAGFIIFAIGVYKLASEAPGGEKALKVVIPERPKEETKKEPEKSPKPEPEPESKVVTIYQVKPAYLVKRKKRKKA